MVDDINVVISEEETINVTVTGGIGGDEKLKISANDTTSNYLEPKLVAGNDITLTVNNEGANETITVASIATAVTKYITKPPYPNKKPTLMSTKLLPLKYNKVFI